MAVCKLCPYKNHCWGKGECETCDFGKAFEGLDKKIKKLKSKNEALQIQNEKIFDDIENNSYEYGVNFLISKEMFAEIKKNSRKREQK